MEIEHPQDQKSVSESRYSTSDKLAAALASGSAVVVIILALVEKTPLSVGLLVLLMVAFAVYPAIHFFRSILARVTVLVVVLVIGIVIGWQALKREKPREIVAARTSGPTNAATTPEHNALPVVPPQKKKRVSPAPPHPNQPTYSVTNPTDSIVNQNSPNYDDQTVIHNPPVNPNKVVTTYEFTGIRHDTSPGVFKASDAEVAAFQQMKDKINVSDWKGLLSIAEDAKKRAPEWLTPYSAAGEAYASLCDKDKAITNLEFLVKQAEGSPTYDGAVSDAKKIIGILENGKFLADCSSGSLR